MYGKYIYGVIIGGGDAVLGVRELAGTGLVHAITHEGLSCVVSDYTGGDFCVMSQEERVRCLMAHQVVVEQVTKRRPILPVKSGTVLADPDEVGELLAQGHPQFFLTLLWIQDKIEVGVVATRVDGQVPGENGDGPGMLLGEGPVFSEQLSGTQRHQGYLEQMIGFLNPVSVDVQPHPISPEDTAASVAFLVDGANLEAFRGRIKRLNALLYNQIDFQVIGPLPPYSFVTVEVSRPSPGAIEEARQMLNLSEVADEVEVRQAYRRLMAETASARKPGDKLAGARSVALRRASDLLVAYCRGQSEKDGRFLISIRRSRSDEVQPPRRVEIEGLKQQAKRPL